jgi:hypothetical protein
MFVWGYTVLTGKEYKLSIYITNFLLAMEFWFQHFSDARFTPEIELFTDVYELSGNIGFSSVLQSAVYSWAWQYNLFIAQWRLL